MFLGGLPHDVDAGGHYLTRALIPQLFVEPRRADYVGEYDGEFDVFGHGRAIITI
jgi:hypothetical protein